MKKVLALRGRKRFFLRLVLILLVAAGLLLFLRARKDTLLKHSTRWLASCLSVGTDLEFHIGKLSGNGFGFIKLQDVEVKEPWLGSEQATIFKAKEIRFRYHVLDFLSKRSHSKMEVTVVDPEVHWRPRVGLKKPSLPIFGLLQQWAMAKQEQITLRVKGLAITLGAENKVFKGIDFVFQNNSFALTWPVSHFGVGGADLSTTIRFEGHFEPGAARSGDALTGQIRTEGTVVNWKPLTSEMQFDFIFTEENFRITSTDFLGGLDVDGEIDFSRDTPMNVVIRAEKYPLSRLGPFLNVDPHLPVPGLLDMEMRFSGSPWEPRLETRLRIYNGWLGKKNFRATDIHLEGVMPTLRLTDSRILLEDGSVMRFADKTLEIRDLMRPQTYKALIEEAQQESVVMGDWSFSRPKDMKDKPEFLMQRRLGDDASIHFRKFNDTREAYDASESHNMEVGFEYRLQSKNFLKVGIKEDEEFVGVERKVRF